MLARLRARSRRAMPERAAACWRRASRSASARSSASRATPASSPSRARSCRSTPSRAPTSSCSTRSASSRSSISWRPRCSSAAASVDHGGHNILEPAVFGKPIVFGPHMQNFKEIAEAFLQQRRGDPGAVGARARRRAAGARHRSGAPGAPRRCGARAGRRQSRRQGEDARRHRRAAAVRRRSGHGRRSSVPSAWCIDPASERGLRRGGGVATRVVRARPGARQRRLRRPVVSVGNLRVGGSGKTPIVGYIARLLRRAGRAAGDPARAATAAASPRDGVTVVSDGTGRPAPASTTPATSR